MQLLGVHSSGLNEKGCLFDLKKLNTYRNEKNMTSVNGMELPVLSQAALHQAGFGGHCFLTAASLLPQVSAFTNHAQLLP